MRLTSFQDETPSLDTSITQRSRGDTSDGKPGIRNTVGLQDLAAQSTAHEQPILDHGNSSDYNSEDGEDEEKPQKAQRPGVLPHPSSKARQISFVDEDEAPSTSAQPPKAGPIPWSDLPQKRQLAILTMARLSEPLTQTSLQAYMFYQLKSFDHSLPDSTISSQAGMLQGSFTAAQFVTAIIWGRIADADWGGRKNVLLIGLFGTCLSCVGFGFSRSFWQAAVFRTLGGVLNGNVGVMRTMISEIIKEKRWVLCICLLWTRVLINVAGFRQELFCYFQCVLILVVHIRAGYEIAG